MVIYKVTNIVNNKIYIGQTSQPVSKRWIRHCYESRRYKKFLQPLHAAIAKHGRDNFKIEIIATAQTREELNKLEIDLIAQYDSLSPVGYNLQLGGNSRAASEETRKRQSLAHLGQTSWNKNKPLSEEHKQAVRDAHKRKYANGYVSKNLGVKRPGSGEASAKLSRKTYYVQSPDGTKYVVTDIKKFAAEHGLLRSSLHKAATGSRKQYRGWTRYSPNLN